MEKTDNELIAELGYKILRDGSILGIRGNPIAFTVKNGYSQMNITLNGKTKSFLVHRLVALEYCLNPSNKKEVNHINGIKTDNRVENLEWVTRSENIKHGISTGLIKKSMVYRLGKKHWKSIPVLQYKDDSLITKFESSGDASRKTGFHRVSIQDACTGKLKTYKGFTWKYQ
jgi:hypothetical protein